MLKEFFIGTDLKFRFEIEAEGFDITSDKYSLFLTQGDDVTKVPPENIVDDGEGNYYLLVDTKTLKKGNLGLIVTVFIPDDDFKSGVRKEITKVSLCNIKEIWNVSELKFLRFILE